MEKVIKENEEHRKKIYIGRNVYDTVDTKLGEYLNNYPERQKLKIMFLRESEGVY